MAQGQQTSYVGTIPQKRVVSDRIIMTEPMEIPLISALGLGNEGKFHFVNTPGKVYEWLEDTYSPLSDVAASGTLSSDSTATVLAMTDGSKFQPGDVLQVDAESMWVSGVSANNVTVTRNYSGTQATHASTSTIYIRSRARLEGASASDSHFTQPTSGYNYSFILHKNIEVSASDSRLQRYGIPNLVNYEITKKMDELKRDLTRKPYYGVRGAGSTSTPRDCGGFDTFISTNAVALTGSPTLTQKMIEDRLQAAWDNGGKPTLMVCGAWAKRKIADMFSGSIRTTQSDTMGGVTINKFLSALGFEVDVLVDRYCPPASMQILDPTLIGFITLREFAYEELGKSKDTAAYGQIVGEYGFVVADEKKHAKLSGFSLTA